MLKHLSVSSRRYVFGAALFALPVIAQVAAPSQEFWDYLAEYGDENGEVLDPLEYDQILNMKDDSDEIAKDESSSANHTKNDTKLEQKSSAQASSRAMKGVK